MLNSRSVHDPEVLNSRLSAAHRILRPDLEDYNNHPDFHLEDVSRDESSSNSGDREVYRIMNNWVKEDNKVSDLITNIILLFFIRRIMSSINNLILCHYYFKNLCDSLFHYVYFCQFYTRLPLIN